MEQRFSEGNLESNRTIAINDKEAVNALNQTKAKKTKKALFNKTLCGLLTPCVFGAHNPNFNKNKSL